MTSRTVLTLAPAVAAAFFAGLWVADRHRERNDAPADAAAGTAVMLRNLNDQMAGVVERVLPAVISINTERVLTPRDPADGSAAVNADSRLQREPGVGSGVVVTPQGHAITNWHVVSGERVDIYVTLHGEVEPRRATLVDRDEERDIAVILVDPRRPGEVFRALPFGDSDRMRPGHIVLALGNPLNLAETVTLGIVSNRARRISDTYTTYLQTDCVINPGNSGGPLINLQGELIGINTRLVLGADRSSVSQGYGLAIPSNEAQDAFERLMSRGRPRGYLGITVDDWPGTQLPDPSGMEGAVVLGIEAGSPAADAGLRRGDVILAFAGQPVTGSDSFFRLLRKVRVGDTVGLEVSRDGETLALNTVIGNLDAVFEEEEEPEEAAAGGVTVRALRRSERSRWQVRGESGVLVESVAGGSPLHGLVTEGDLILGFADEERNSILEVNGPDSFRGHLEAILPAGGYVYVYRPQGMERIAFPGRGGSRANQKEQPR